MRPTWGKSPHLGVQNWVELQARGVIAEGLWARAKSHQCQVPGHADRHPVLPKPHSEAVNVPSRSRLQPLTAGAPLFASSCWDAPWPGRYPARQVPGPSLGQRFCHIPTCRPTPTSDLPRISRKPTAGNLQQGQHISLPPNSTQRHPTPPNSTQRRPRPAAQALLPLSQPSWHFTFAIWGMLGSLLNPARGILSCSVFTLDLPEEQKGADAGERRGRAAGCSRAHSHRSAGCGETTLC